MDQRILILSPHLDDAVLSCADHMLAWKRKGARVHVISVFTAFPQSPSTYVREILAQSGRLKAASYERQRKCEDARAMGRLGVTFEHWDYVDGAFRRDADGSLYTHATLFFGKISSRDDVLMGQLRKRLKLLPAYDRVYTPLGIGNHADHVMVKTVVKRVFPESLLGLYADYPYACRPQAWLWAGIKAMAFHTVSVKFMSRTKRALLQLYNSQHSLLFDGDPRYPELLIRQ